MRHDPLGKPRKKALPVKCRWCGKMFEPRTFQKRPQFCKKLCEVRFKAGADREGE